MGRWGGGGKWGGGGGGVSGEVGWEGGTRSRRVGGGGGEGVDLSAMCPTLWSKALRHLLLTVLL